MSFRELTVIDVREVLRRWAAGQSARQMAREGVVSRRTVTRYVEAAKSLGLIPSDELTDERVRVVARSVQARPMPTASEPRQLLDARRIQIEQWLNQDEPLTLLRIRELLARDGSAVSYTTLRRWAQAVLGFGERAPRQVFAAKARVLWQPVPSEPSLCDRDSTSSCSEATTCFGCFERLASTTPEKS